MKTYIVYDIQGYDMYDQQKDLFMGVVQIKVIAKSEDEALQKAKINHPGKEHFRCIGSIEYILK